MCFCSFLEEDPLYIAYADMMAKVSVVFNLILLNYIVIVLKSQYSISQYFILQSCAENEEEEEEEGKEKTFEVFNS